MQFLEFAELEMHEVHPLLVHEALNQRHEAHQKFF